MVSSPAALLVTLVAAGGLAGCGDDDGTGQACERCDAGADDDGDAAADDDGIVEHVGPPPTFTEIYDDILSAKCSTADACHAASNRSGFLGYGSRDQAYDEQVGVLAMGSNCRSLDWTRVVPFDPDASLLLAKLMDTAMCGARMPAAGEPLEPRQIAAVRAWIEAGAPND